MTWEIECVPHDTGKNMMIRLDPGMVSNTYALDMHKHTEMGYEVSGKPGFIPMTPHKDAKDE